MLAWRKIDYPIGTQRELMLTAAYLYTRANIAGMLETMFKRLHSFMTQLESTQHRNKANA